MSTAGPVLDSEPSRLARLIDLMVLDTEPEAVFDSLARLASEFCEMPVSLVSLIDAKRQWFKANLGLAGVTETPRDLAFCAHTIQGDRIFEVADARLDPRFAENPLVTGAANIRFYAGAPLVMPGGERIGTICVIDHQARHLTAAQSKMLESLSELAVQALLMRQDLIRRSLAARGEYERRAAASEARHRAMIDLQSDLVSLARSDGTLLEVNPAYARHFGRTVEGMGGTNLFDYVSPADHAAVRQRIDHVLGSGATVSAENRMVVADGSERWVTWTNASLPDLDGTPLLHSVGRDVTDRKRAEHALRDSEAFLQQTGRVAGVGGWDLDWLTGRVHWSDQTRRIHEVDPSFTPTLDNAISFYAPEARPIIEGAVKQGLETGQPWDLELPLVTATGRRVWVRAVGEVEFVEGRPARLFGAFQDISERKQLEQKVNDNERFLRQLTDSLPARIAYLDRDRRYRFVNEEWLRGIGRSRDQVLGRTRNELLPNLDDTEVSERARAALAGQAQQFEIEAVLAGQVRRFENRLIPDRAESGEVCGFFVIGVDITERSAAEKAMRELTAIFENTTDFVVQTNHRGQLLYMNPSARQGLGLGLSDPVSHLLFTEFNTPATNRLYVEAILPAVHRGEVWVGQTTVYLAGQREVPVSHMVIAHRDAAGRIDRYSALMRDISKEVLAQQEIVRQTTTLRSVTDAIPATVAVLDNDRKYRLVNPAFERWRGLPAASILGHDAREILGEAEFERRWPWMQRALAGETVSFELDYPGRDRSAHMAISYMPLRLGAGEPDGFVAVSQDISGQKREQSRLQRLAQRDPLTGLLNRAGFEEHLDQVMTDGSGTSLAILYIDLDRFKPVNDRYGHPVGDQILQMFAQRLVKLVRPTDAVARLGGDEFAIALAGVREEANAMSVGKKVVTAAQSVFHVGEHLIKIGASVGVAHGASSEDGWRGLVERADNRLLAAKAAGRGRPVGEGG